jgi:hypothetical protein
MLINKKSIKWVLRQLLLKSNDVLFIDFSLWSWVMSQTLATTTFGRYVD